jgi:hypothetical protein
MNAHRTRVCAFVLIEARSQHVVCCIVDFTSAMLQVWRLWLTSGWAQGCVALWLPEKSKHIVVYNVGTQYELQVRRSLDVVLTLASDHVLCWLHVYPNCTHARKRQVLIYVKDGQASF